MCFMINERIESESMQQFCLCYIDAEVVSIIVGNNIILTAFYKPPSDYMCAFLEFFESYLTFFVMHKYYAIISANFNIDMLSLLPNSVSLYVLLYSHEFIIATKISIRITPTSAETLLDH